MSPKGIPFLATEIQLLYKAKTLRPKDCLDFTTILPLLTDTKRAWQRNVIRKAYGEGND
jgi:hypothetical protein